MSIPSSILESSRIVFDHLTRMMFKSVFIFLLLALCLHNTSSTNTTTTPTPTRRPIKPKATAPKPVLKYNLQGKFKIVQFTDLHYGEGEDENTQTYAIQELIMEKENPDFCMFSGDMISGNSNNFDKNISLYYSMWDMFTEPCSKRGIPWAIVFGNHDGFGPWSTSRLMDLELSYNLSLSQRGPADIDGISNFVLEIQGSNSTQPSSLMYMFDSDTTNCQGEGWWGCIHENQVAWYKNQSNHYKLPAISFVHIPPFEAIELWNDHTIYGQFRDTGVCCYYTADSGFVSSMLEQKDIKGLYFGHDHGCDYHGDYFGIDIGYGRKTGYGSYNTELLHGARLIQLTESPYSIETWIRNVNGDIEDQPKHEPNRQQALPLTCCTTLDNKNNRFWGIYLGCFSAILFVAFVIQWSGVTKYIS
ncbi:hypothetical protein DFA_08796 [Cavenderia fasciculata]|uniref:Calcineurin-like phosphoesterase domain-containing protein n=1 Tax=Cavenderia fasciculata TaxID=261658 RepID=F4Q494_CACFS|nr:uncharacterized protein DFA_08796 [Cavenderia fasciculata]EGG17796.1 hypothetical protein DFA_08796 [Cavenderia fasciculata]|eukprot:XP_004356280.1 hypothetical protein DFA_08796 [Cavenderia fasciculata]